jgi:hypothetical protein
MLGVAGLLVKFFGENCGYSEIFFLTEKFTVNCLRDGANCRKMRDLCYESCWSGFAAV